MLMFKVIRLIHCRKRDNFKPRFSPPEFMALKFFEEKNTGTASELAAEMNIRKSTVTILVQKLIFQGFLKKETNEKDARSAYIKVTEKGKTELKNAEESFSKLAEPLFDVLSVKEKATLQELFEKVLTKNSHD